MISSAVVTNNFGFDHSIVWKWFMKSFHFFCIGVSAAAVLLIGWHSWCQPQFDTIPSLLWPSVCLKVSEPRKIIIIIINVLISHLTCVIFIYYCVDTIKRCQSLSPNILGVLIFLSYLSEVICLYCLVANVAVIKAISEVFCLFLGLF